MEGGGRVTHVYVPTLLVLVVVGPPLSVAAGQAVAAASRGRGLGCGRGNPVARVLQVAGAGLVHVDAEEELVVLGRGTGAKSILPKCLTGFNPIGTRPTSG